jgi:hypothetical protein
MNDLERFEQELRSLKPARPPAEFMERLRELEPARVAPQADSHGQTQWLWAHLVRWLVPATAVLAAAGFVWFKYSHPKTQHGRSLAVTVPPPLKADSVQIDEQLVGAFDAVGRLPNGEPVRFHCREWMDNVVLRDKTRGVVIEQRTPRVEVVPVRFETY